MSLYKYNNVNVERNLIYKMGDEDLYKGDIKNYYNTPYIIKLTNDKSMVNNSFPDGKAQRREHRARAIKRRKGRL